MPPLVTVYPVGMFNEAQVTDMLGQLLSSGVEKTLEMASQLDDMEESDAVMKLALAALEANTPQLILAIQWAALAIRWHRTRQMAAAVNTPAPGQ